MKPAGLMHPRPAQLPEWQHVMSVTARTVREVRGLLGWSQQTLGDRASVSQGAISRLEAGPGEGLPLYTAVKVLSTLAAGAQAVELSLSPAAQGILNFAKLFTGPVDVTTPLQADLVQLMRAFHRLPLERRKAMVRLIEAANDLFGRSHEWAPQTAEGNARRGG